MRKLSKLNIMAIKKIFTKHKKFTIKEIIYAHDKQIDEFQIYFLGMRIYRKSYKNTLLNDWLEKHNKSISLFGTR